MIRPTGPAETARSTRRMGQDQVVRRTRWRLPHRNVPQLESARVIASLGTVPPRTHTHNMASGAENRMPDRAWLQDPFTGHFWWIRTAAAARHAMPTQVPMFGPPIMVDRPGIRRASRAIAIIIEQLPPLHHPSVLGNRPSRPQMRRPYHSITYQLWGKKMLSSVGCGGSNQLHNRDLALVWGRGERARKGQRRLQADWDCLVNP
jgi:hypothetical protein